MREGPNSNSNPNSNLKRSKCVIEACVGAGIAEFVVCAGARNAPLVQFLERLSSVKKYQFFDERSASFFALGRMRDSGKPVAVVTTSGTAVSECLSAVIESHYQSLPMVIVSADRPRRFRGSGSPQSIEQVGIFSGYIEFCLDIEDFLADMDFSGWSRKRPVQVNVCFEEPQSAESFVSESLTEEQVKPGSNGLVERTEAPASQMSLLSIVGSTLLKNPMVILGEISREGRPYVTEFLKRTSPYVYAESLSMISNLPQSLRSLDGLDSSVVGSVLRIGGVPTCRFWRDCEEKFKDLRVVNVVERPFSGLARASETFDGFEALKSLQIEVDNAYSEYFEAFRIQTEKGFFALIETFPQSETAQMFRLSALLIDQFVYVGNSLPIRNWDLVSFGKSYVDVCANRGANGIDGQISTFLGWTADTGGESWAIVGDLTALYDLSALWGTQQLQKRKRRIVVINNHGGMIFKSMFGAESFLNRHNIEFSKWAEMFGWQYLKWSEVPKCIPSGLADSCIVEIVPDQTQSDLFQNRWKTK